MVLLKDLGYRENVLCEAYICYPNPNTTNDGCTELVPRIFYSARGEPILMVEFQ
jgi:hypothetical protein